ncbi:MAG TPA: ATP synthase F0 subunit C [Coriobacteriia bacterium]|nr:ATP synthase F0 subunit C [Coriobacteriia bacterium]
MNGVLLALVTVLPIAIGAAVAAFAMKQISTSAIDGMTRQPEIAPQLFTAMLIGMALVEALCIYTLVVTLVMANNLG